MALAGQTACLKKKSAYRRNHKQKQFFVARGVRPCVPAKGTSDIVQRTDDEATYLANPDEFILVSGDLSPTP